MWVYSKINMRINGQQRKSIVRLETGCKVLGPAAQPSASRLWSGGLAECVYRELSWPTSPEGRWGQHSWAVGRGLSHTLVKVCL